MVGWCVGCVSVLGYVLFVVRVCACVDVDVCAFFVVFRREESRVSFCFFEVGVLVTCGFRAMVFFPRTFSFSFRKVVAVAAFVERLSLLVLVRCFFFVFF